MRFSLPVAMLAFLAVTRTASADVITENFAISGSPGFPVSVYGDQFNPALGTLENVTIGIQGTFHADIYFPELVQPTVYDDLTASITTPEQPTSIDFGYFLLTGGANNIYTGSTTFEAETDLSSVQDYVSGYPPPTTALLAEIALQDYVPANRGYYIDNSTYSGTLTVTYGYAVPEPSSLAILGAGVAALLIATAGTRGFRRLRSNILHI